MKTLSIIALTLFLGACVQGTFTYTTHEECHEQGREWKLGGTGHESGAQLPVCADADGNVYPF